MESSDRRQVPVWRQPLVHFLALGAILFAVDAYRTDDDPGAAGSTIRVSTDRVERLRETFRRRQGRSPDESELEGLVSEWIRKEMLYRRALQLGLHRSDPIVRRRLVQAMRFMVEGTERRPAPERKALRRYYREHRENYAEPPTFTFRHVFASERSSAADRDSGGAPSRAADRIDRILTRLESGADWKQLGDPFVHGREMTAKTPADLRRRFGGAFLEALRNGPVGEWFGPVPSSYGRHAVLVEERHTGEPRPFREVASDVREDYLADRKRTGKSSGFERLRRRFDVRIDPSAVPFDPSESRE